LPENILRIALRKLTQIYAAATLSFLRVPPTDRPEKLTGDRESQWSIRINDQWRICFEWRDGDAEDIEITDYH
jgi:toxin HigB-1